MRLIVLHYHLRPGGIRRIIEQATPHIAGDSGLPIHRVTLATGEPADPRWHAQFAAQLAPVPVECCVDESFGYFGEQRFGPAALRAEIAAALARILDDGEPSETVVWAHNLGLARNAVLANELARACAARNIPLIAHHHDWWFDNRWLRWPELKRAGFRTLGAAARAVLPSGRTVRHVAINSADTRVLRRGFGTRTHWLPNLTQRTQLPDANDTRRAAEWLHRRIGTGGAPVWLVPCRLLRRKNIAEALLLTRWLRPEAWLASTGGASSPDEQAYASRLVAAAEHHGWRLKLGVLAGNGPGKPSVPELLAASEAVLLTSIQEGFGLPFLEAAAAVRPLIARSLPNVAPDLTRFGFKFPQLYDDVRIDPSLLDWDGEVKRQSQLFDCWRRQLPRQCRRFVGTPQLLARTRPAPVPFSRLTLTAQLEVLAAPIDLAWQLCAPLNPWLAAFRRRAEDGALKVTRWPPSADAWLSGAAYAQHFREIVAQPARNPVDRQAAGRAQDEFIRERLKAKNLFPLLWARES